MENKKAVPDFWAKEDWQAIWIGAIVIIIACFAVLTKAFDFSAIKFATWTLGENLSEAAAAKVVPLGEQLASLAFWRKLLVTFVTLGVLFTLGVKLQGGSIKKYIPAFIALFVISLVVRLVSAEFTLNRYLEWAFWALLIGLLISNTVGVPEWLKPAIKTEFYIKTGLVITLASATSVCGTSAAIATGAASNCKKTDLTMAVSISIIFTVLMMVFEPIIIKATGMSPIMGGALIGGTVDSTGAVAVAGSTLGGEAEKAAVLVKMIQNILIGFIAFFVAVFFATRVDRTGNQKVGAGEIWTRFPKFILGFFVASLVASFVILPAFGSDQVSAINKVLDQYKNWAFVLAFTSIGLDTNFKEIIKQMQGGKVLWLYIIGQLFNIALTFFAVWFLLSGKIFPIPVLD